ncbi:c-type cytochrome [Sphingobacterium corticis]|uniref:C-type cytochrome n=1 Tax=Sphingobacterium corticis TaxID=1812823 RepID=A0ABW5NGT4_9SPHI
MQTRIAIFIAGIVFCMAAMHSCHAKHDIKTMQYVTNGEKVYRAHCQNCHGGQGEGLGKLYPPLTDPQYLKENHELLPRIIRYGLRDTIHVSGNTYAENMPAIPELTEIDIAYVLSYITIRFGEAEKKYELDEVKASLKR